MGSVVQCCLLYMTRSLRSRAHSAVVICNDKVKVVVSVCLPWVWLCCEGTGRLMHPALRARLGPLSGTQHLFRREEGLREQWRSVSGVAGCSLSGTRTGCQVHKQINTLCVVSTVEKDSLSQDGLSHFLVGNHIFLFLSLLLLKHTRGSRGRQRVESCYVPCQEGPKRKHTTSLLELLKKADVLQTNRRP